MGANKTVIVTSQVAKVQGMTRRAMEVAAEMIGGIIEGHAKELCPVDTGLLHNSIIHARSGQAVTKVYTSNTINKKGETIGTKIGKVSQMFPAEQDQNKVTVYVGTNVEYAPYVELGHAQEPGRYVPAIGKRLKASWVDARPFLRPAAENYTSEILQALQLAVKNAK